MRSPYELLVLGPEEADPAWLHEQLGQHDGITVASITDADELVLAAAARADRRSRERIGCIAWQAELHLSLVDEPLEEAIAEVTRLAHQRGLAVLHERETRMQWGTPPPLRLHDDPGPVWEHLPVASLAAPPRETLAVGDAPPGFASQADTQSDRQYRHPIAPADAARHDVHRDQRPAALPFSDALRYPARTLAGAVGVVLVVGALGGAAAVALVSEPTPLGPTTLSAREALAGLVLAPLEVLTLALVAALIDHDREERKHEPVRWLPVLVLAVVGGIALQLGAFLIVAPVLIAACWGLAPVVMVRERSGARHALARSEQLTAGHRLRIAFLFVASAIVPLTLGAAGGRLLDHGYESAAGVVIAGMTVATFALTAVLALWLVRLYDHAAATSPSVRA